MLLFRHQWSCGADGTVYGIRREVPHDGSLSFEEASFIWLRDLTSPAL
jgi:hypothetical protein